MKNKVNLIALGGIMIALTTIATMIIQIPVAATNGYIHLGDSVILISGFFFGPVIGFIAGGFGSALADFMSGYGHWVPFTFFIKGLMGLAFGFLISKISTRNSFSPKIIFFSILAELIMIIGYFIVESFLYNSVAVALSSIFSNAIQGFTGVIIFILISKSLSKFIK